MACNIYMDLPGGGKMPVLGFGTFNGKGDELEVALHTALEAGYRHIDTANVYDNEHVIGKVLNEWLSSGKIKRHEIFITTKLPTDGMRPSDVQRYMKLSLEKLQLDYVDLYLVHCPFGTVLNANDKKIDPKTDLEAIWKAMEEQVGQKRTKYIGISNFNQQQIERILNAARIKPANLQVEVHAYLQQNELLKFCKDNSITVVGYCPLGNPGINTFFKTLNMPEKQLPGILQDLVVAKIAKYHNKTPAQILLRHLIQKGVSVIPKSVTPSRIRENINLFDFQLAGPEMEQLNKLNKPDESARICDMKTLKFEFVHQHPVYK